MDVFFLRVSDYEACPDRFFAPLISGETRRAGLACGNPRVRLTKWLGEAMVRCLLRSIWGLKPSDYCILRGAHGKPYVSAAIPVFFNLSHSGDYVVCAVGGEEVGIDIERRGRVRMEVARRYFHPDEVALLEHTPPEQRTALFFDHWSVKESYLKYTGEGLADTLSACKVSFSGTVTIERGHSLQPVAVQECPIDKTYSCFICTARPEAFGINHFQF